MPLVEGQLYQPYGDQGFAALGVNVGPYVLTALEILSGSGVSFPILFDVDDRVMDEYRQVGEGASLFPLAYLIDRAGIIRGVYNGQEPDLGALEQAILTLLEE